MVVMFCESVMSKYVSTSAIKTPYQYVGCFGSGNDFKQ